MRRRELPAPAQRVRLTIDTSRRPWCPQLHGPAGLPSPEPLPSPAPERAAGPTLGCQSNVNPREPSQAGTHLFGRFGQLCSGSLGLLFSGFGVVCELLHLHELVIEDTVCLGRGHSLGSV